MTKSKELLGVPPHREVDAWMLGDRGHPPCFDSAGQYESWAEAADAAQDAELSARGICADCTLLHRNKMINQGRCSRILEPFARHQTVASATVRSTAPVAAKQTTPAEEENHVD